MLIVLTSFVFSWLLSSWTFIILSIFFVGIFESKCRPTWSRLYLPAIVFSSSTIFIYFCGMYWARLHVETKDTSLYYTFGMFFTVPLSTWIMHFIFSWFSKNAPDGLYLCMIIGFSSFTTGLISVTL